ncbi:MAG: exodeoxyribonuclease VII large subunit [Patescibacteria group bacterium]
MIRSILDEAPALHGIWVRGELAGFLHHNSGHMYFLLKDAGARLRCVMFRDKNRHLRFKPADGIEVMARGSIGVYERNGEYQLYVETLEPAGLGALHLAFLQLRDKLAAEGLFDRARKRPLPPFPRRIALVTSPTGAAVRDMIEILHQRQPGLDILVIPVLVQGPEAAASIAAGLATASRLDGLDLVIVGRGGGSPEELWPFNEEIVAQAVAACRYPVISAVGHEIDFTIADFVADARAATPTAAAEMAAADAGLLLRQVREMRDRLEYGARRNLARAREAAARLAASPALQRPERFLAAPRQALDETRQGLLRAGRERLRRLREVLGAAAGRLDSLSPLATLRRGYAICRLPDGRVVRSAAAVAPRDELEILLRYGRLRCQVTTKEEADGGDTKEDL